LAKLQILAVRNLLKRESPSERRRAPSPAPRGRSSPLGREVAPRGSGPARMAGAGASTVQRAHQALHGPEQRTRKSAADRRNRRRAARGAARRRFRALRLGAGLAGHHRRRPSSSSGQSRIIIGLIAHHHRDDSASSPAGIERARNLDRPLRGGSGESRAGGSERRLFFRGRHAPRLARRGFRALPRPATLPIAVASG
jgi:hypothetical protein